MFVFWTQPWDLHSPLLLLVRSRRSLSRWRKFALLSMSLIFLRLAFKKDQTKMLEETQGATTRRRQSWLTNIYEPKCGGGGGFRGLSNECRCAVLCTWSPNEHWRSNSILTYEETTPNSSVHSVTHKDTVLQTNFANIFLHFWSLKDENIIFSTRTHVLVQILRGSVI